MKTHFRFPIAIKYYAKNNGIEFAIKKTMQFAKGKKPNKLEALYYVKSLLKKGQE